MNMYEEICKIVGKDDTEDTDMDGEKGYIWFPQCLENPTEAPYALKLKDDEWEFLVGGIQLAYRMGNLEKLIDILAALGLVEESSSRLERQMIKLSKIFSTKIQLECEEEDSWVCTSSSDKSLEGYGQTANEALLSYIDNQYLHLKEKKSSVISKMEDLDNLIEELSDRL